MEATGVVNQAVVLLLFFTTNSYGQSGESGISLSQSQIPAVGGIPHGSFILRNYPYSDPLQHRRMSLPDMAVPQPYPLALDTETSLTSSFFTSLLAYFKNTGYVTLALLDLTDADRRDKVRTAASNLNDILDIIEQTFKKIIAYKDKAAETIMNIPVIGFIVRILDNIVYYVNYIPIQVFDTITKFIRKAFSVKQPDYEAYAVPGIPPYAFA